MLASREQETAPRKPRIINGETKNPLATGWPITWHPPKLVMSLKSSKSVDMMRGYTTPYAVKTARTVTTGGWENTVWLCVLSLPVAAREYKPSCPRTARFRAHINALAYFW
jgi:hypothetical protein